MRRGIPLPRSAAARPRRLAAAGISPRMNARRPADASLSAALPADGRAVIVQGTQFGQVPVCLFQVVAEDLLRLEGAVALLVVLVGPGHELLVKPGALPFQDAVIRSVANEEVVESMVGNRCREPSGLDAPAACARATP